jgi:hypothetical protein
MLGEMTEGGSRMRFATFALASMVTLLPVSSGPPPEPIPRRFFGMVIHPGPAGKEPKTIRNQPWPSVPLGSIRLWDTSTDWVGLNPRKGVFNWRLLDEYLDQARAHDLDVLYAFGRMPPWASTNPTGKCGRFPGVCYPAKDLEDWDNFVSALARHAKGRIHAYELWNEANLPNFWRGDDATLVEMARRASKIIKSIDPAAIILTPSYASSADAALPHGAERRYEEMASGLSRFFAGGGGAYVDAVAMHGYMGADPEIVPGLIARIRAVMASYGQSAKPLWNTEAAWGGTPQLVARLPDEGDRAAFVARYYALNWANGVQRFYWYAWNNKIIGTLWDPDTQTLLEPGAAYGEVYRWLVGATMTEACTRGPDSITKCGLSRPGGYAAQMVWDSYGSKDYSPPAEFIRYRELDGSTVKITKGGPINLGRKPILLENSIPR